LTGEIPASLLNLNNLSPGATDFSYNALHTANADLIAFLDDKDLGWAETQTIAPANVRVRAFPQIPRPFIALSWEPITYTGDTGGYRVFKSTNGVQFTFVAQTANKSATAHRIYGLTPGTIYYFMIRTRTDAHQNNNNIVDSERSRIVRIIIPTH